MFYGHFCAHGRLNGQVFTRHKEVLPLEVTIPSDTLLDSPKWVYDKINKYMY